MKWRWGLLSILLATLCGCFPTIQAPTVIPVSDLTPPASSGVVAREPVFTVVIDRFRDERSNRSILGQYDNLGKGGFAGTVTITSDRDITEVFEDLVKKSLNRRGIQPGPSPFILRGVIKKANVGASPDSQTIKADVFLELTIVNSNTGAYLWKKSYLGSASGIDPKLTLAHAFQDLANVVDQDDSPLALRQIFLASGGKLPEAATYARLSENVRNPVTSDVDELPAFKTKPNKKSYAIVIGIEHYRQKLPRADFAVHDAQTVTEYLANTMGFPEENIITLLNEHAAKSDLEKYFEKWLPNNAGPGSSVFVYYSGHGAPNLSSGDAYLVPFDGDPSYIDQTGYSLARMYGALGKLPAAEVFVVVDSCFSGAGGRSVLAKGARPLVMDLKAASVPRNITVLSASSGEQISMSYDEKGHGLFTYFFLKGIKAGAVMREDGLLDVVSLYAYVKPQVQSISRKKYNNEQTPQLIGAKKN